MTLGGIIIILMLVVSVITFIYLLVVTARGWGWLHALLLFCLFAECWVFMIFSAGVLYRRGGWLKQAQTLRERAEKAELETIKLTWGDFEGRPDAQNAVVPVQGELRRLTADRGRVWRRLDLLNQDNGVYTLEPSTQAAAAADDLSAPDPAAAPVAPVDVASSLPQNLVVYAFAEEVDTEGRPLPTFYLGEFTITSAQGSEVVLTPTLPLQQMQLDAIKGGAAQTWTLYELLPLDSHTAFAAPGSVPTTNEGIFGRMDEETLNNLFANIPEPRREAIVQRYLTDGQRAGDTVPQRARWVRVKVLKEWDIEVDSTEDAIATERGFYDTSGRSIDVRLKRGEDGHVKLTPETQSEFIVLKSEVADDLISKGIVELIEPTYVRPLIDYQEAFQHLYVRLHEIREHISLYQRDTGEMTKANLAGQEMISFRQIENQALTEDLGHYRTELDVLNEELKLISDKLASTKSTLSGWYRAIQARVQ